CSRCKAQLSFTTALKKRKSKKEKKINKEQMYLSFICRITSLKLPITFSKFSAISSANTSRFGGLSRSASESKTHVTPEPFTIHHSDLPTNFHT
ncbi:MAG TPA: hypothetical protein VK369_11720, partial [Segetibacter sp.]|nr:hypothetical protein [Segetibacter sp.]